MINIDILEIFKVSEAYQLPNKIMQVLLSDSAELTLKQLKDNNITNLRDYFQSEHGDRDRLKQDYTPDSICSIVGKLSTHGTVLDMCAGTGALTKAVLRERRTKIYEQEFSQRAIAFALLDNAIDGNEGIIEQADCLRNKVFKRYQLIKQGEFSKVFEIDPTDQTTQLFNTVVMNPPYSMKFDEADQTYFLGLRVPKQRSDLAFVLQGIQRTKEKGRLLAILPHGVLFRDNREKEIRKYLVDNHLLNAVIGLPQKMFMNTDIPTCLVILERNSQNIFFVDASKNFTKSNPTNVMTEEQIDKVVNTVKSRNTIDKFSNLATADDVINNNYNLNIPRYVDTFEPEPPVDLIQVSKDLEEDELKISELSYKLAQMLESLSPTNHTFDMSSVKKSVSALKAMSNASKRRARHAEPEKEMTLF